MLNHVPPVFCGQFTPCRETTVPNWLNRTFLRQKNLAGTTLGNKQLRPTAGSDPLRRRALCQNSSIHPVAAELITLRRWQPVTKLLQDRVEFCRKDLHIVDKDTVVSQATSIRYLVSIAYRHLLAAVKASELLHTWFAALDSI
jgi:hypothetical protein